MCIGNMPEDPDNTAGLCMSCYGWKQHIHKPGEDRPCPIHGRNTCYHCNSKVVYVKKYNRFHCSNLLCKIGYPTHAL